MLAGGMRPKRGLAERGSVGTGNSTAVVYSDGLQAGWESWSFGGDFEPAWKEGLLPPGRTEVFEAKSVQPFGGLSLHGSKPIDASRIQALRVTLRSDNPLDDANDLSVSLCACDDCSKTGCHFREVPLQRYLQGSNCSISQDWKAQYKGSRWQRQANAVPSGGLRLPMEDMAPLTIVDGKAVLNTSWAMHRVSFNNENGTSNATFFVGDLWFEMA